MPGPLPVEGHAHRAKPTIPTTSLPASGRPGPVPDPPVSLNGVARSWWDWAWSTPQASGWSSGDMQFLARRAQAQAESIEDRNPTWHRLLNEMDDRLGLTPKGLAALRWKIVADEAEPAAPSGRSSLTLVDKTG